MLGLFALFQLIQDGGACMSRRGQSSRLHILIIERQGFKKFCYMYPKFIIRLCPNFQADRVSARQLVVTTKIIESYAGGSLYISDGFAPQIREKKEWL